MVSSINGRRGCFEAHAPFASVVNKKEIYTIISSRSIPDLVNEGLKVLDVVYTPVSLEDTDMRNDIQNNVYIITLVNAGGKKTYIPENKLVVNPRTNGVEYANRTLVLNLGDLPTELNIDTEIINIKDAVKKELGVNPSHSLVSLSSIMLNTYAEHENLVTLRNNFITVNTPYSVLYSQASEELDKTKKGLADMEKLVIKLQNDLKEAQA